jgi:hypothetical protein
MGGFMHLYAQLRSTSAAKYGRALAGSSRRHRPPDLYFSSETDVTEPDICPGPQ